MVFCRIFSPFVYLLQQHLNDAQTIVTESITLACRWLVQTITPMTRFADFNIFTKIATRCGHSQMAREISPSRIPPWDARVCSAWSGILASHRMHRNRPEIWVTWIRYVGSVGGTSTPLNSIFWLSYQPKHHFHLRILRRLRNLFTSLCSVEVTFNCRSTITCAFCQGLVQLNHPLSVHHQHSRS